MKRRSTGRNLPRKKYTVDAFEGIPELEAVAEPDSLAQLDAAASRSGSDLDARSSDDEPEDEALATLSDASAGAFADDLAESSARRRKTAKERRDNTLEELKEVPGIQEAKEKWANYPALPTCKESLDGQGGFHYSFSQIDVAREKDAKEGWEWYLESGGMERFQAEQRLEALSKDQAEQYPRAQEPRAFVMGPHEQQQFLELRAGQSAALREAWRSASPSSQGAADSASVVDKTGFILNLGAKPRCLEWVPSQHGRAQYLTTSVARDYTPASETDGVDLEPPAEFALCVWRLRADEGYRIDTIALPVPKLVMYTAWGAIKSLKWCRTPRNSIDTLGLLAVIAEDGALRVLDVPLPSDHESREYVLVKQAAFEFKPPGTACTCIAWLSPTRIAIGCADGSAHICDIAQPAPATDMTRTVSMSETHMMSIISCAPSHPEMILASFTDGSLRAADLDEPTPAIVSVNALPPLNVVTRPLLVWHDYSQRALATDDSCMVLARPLRKRKRVKQPMVGKLRSAVTALAGSACHPCILVDTASGEVVATNPLMKAAKAPRDPEAEVWQQTWFAHEWRRPTAQEQSAVGRGSTTTDDHSNPSNGKLGLSRILEDFKPEHIPRETKGKASYAATSDAYTIYEEKTAITALAWNPNLEYGGWAAAASADGLVRLEDISI